MCIKPKLRGADLWLDCSAYHAHNDRLFGVGTHDICVQMVLFGLHSARSPLVVGALMYACVRVCTHAGCCWNASFRRAIKPVAW